MARWAKMSNGSKMPVPEAFGAAGCGIEGPADGEGTEPVPPGVGLGCDGAGMLFEKKAFGSTFGFGAPGEGDGCGCCAKNAFGSTLTARSSST